MRCDQLHAESSLGLLRAAGRLTVIFSCAVVLVFGSGCEVPIAGHAPVASVPSSLATHIHPGATICLLEPKVTFERIEGAPITEPRPKELRGCPSEQAMADDIVRAASVAIQNQGAEVLASSEIASRFPAAVPAYLKLSSDADNLMRGFKPEQTLANLRLFFGSATNALVLVTRCVVKLGEDWSHSRVKAGNVAVHHQSSVEPAINSTMLKGVLLRPEDGSVIWHGDVLLRELPTTDQKNYLRLLDLLFSK